MKRSFTPEKKIISVVDKILVQSPAIRMEIVDNLGADEFALEVLRELAKRDPELKVRMNIVDTLEYMALNSIREEFREKAIHTLGDLALGRV